MEHNGHGPETQFLELIRAHLKYLPAGKQLEPDQNLKALGLDSMAAVDLLLDLEDNYSVTLPDQFLTQETFATAQSLWAAVQQVQGGAVAEGYLRA